MPEKRENIDTVIAALQRKLACLEADKRRLDEGNSHLCQFYQRAPLGYQSLGENGNILSVNQP